ncbi:hypothetical protein L2E82_43856 [Cichorium intybus]|uniref:Uncharacterized protein n=1 Tax=Cichorium intybus TaxID=13427 RepID=A0ACB8ZPT5_CICIN|nr:hypothetical protein L2E82_43856 [Cichorium intybus]
MCKSVSWHTAQAQAHKPFCCFLFNGGTLKSFFSLFILSILSFSPTDDSSCSSSSSSSSSSSPLTDFQID